MYDFADETPSYVHDNPYVQREPEWLFYPESEQARLVHPYGWADERLLSFEPAALEPGWAPAQLAQLLGTTFLELFDEDQPDYHKIRDAAHDWLVRLARAWWGRPEHEARWRVARQLLGGVLDAVEAARRGQPTGWHPHRRGYHAHVDYEEVTRPEALEAPGR